MAKKVNCLTSATKVLIIINFVVIIIIIIIIIKLL